MRRQQGAGGALIAVILALVALLILAVVSMTRSTDTSDQRTQAIASLNTAAAALDSYVSASNRLPCPADPTLDTGVEVTNGPAGCQFPAGTIPWQTIGLSRNTSFDPWGRKISYRVYTGNAGSLTQPGGASMANCDSHEAFPGGATATGGGSGGLCNPVPNTANPADRNTTPEQFLAGTTTAGQPTPAQIIAGKGLTVNDMGTAIPNIAYVLISHGITGLGGYSASGVRLDMPANNGAESDNTNATGPFTITAFSDPDTGSNVKAHFDDLLVYRGIVDLAKRANVAARSWPDSILSAVVLDKATVAAALGSNPGSDTGTATIAFNNATVSAFDSGGSQDISFVSGGGNQDGLGGVSGGDSQLGSAGGEGLRIDFAENARQFAFTLDQFDDSSLVHEQVEVRFIAFDAVTNTATQKGLAVVKQSCASNGKVASYSLDACSAFNRVEIRPLTMTDGTSPSAFTLSEFRTCVAGAACQTSLQPTGNVCSTKVFSPCSIGTNDTSVLTITLANNSSSAVSGVNFNDVYPNYLVNAGTPAASTTCAGGAVTVASTPSGVALSGATVPALGSCNVMVNVTTGALGAYVNSTGSVTPTGTISSATGILTALAHPGVTMAFDQPIVAPNAPALLTFTLANTNTTPITSVGFSLAYPPGLTTAAVPGASTTCGGAASVVASPSGIVFSGGTIPSPPLPGGSCTVTVAVASATTGPYVVTLAVGAVTSENAGASLAAATASFIVN